MDLEDFFVELRGLAAEICLALGANVYVKGLSPQETTRAKELGAIGHWKGPVVNGNSPLLDSIIDSAGGDICARSFKILKHAYCWYRASVPKIESTMEEVLKNVELKGSTTGSRKDLLDATAFIKKHRIIPEVFHGLHKIHEGLKLLREGQIGEIVARKIPWKRIRGSDE
ncbi:uncharacterized protein EI90DRAFT_3127315 [Cantharellus anzutake]|uniref:uncharacterized protein n=1 Tax=Cantharellus anzutake TaxID=1750568 RepID=UPI0019069DCD|nr:uncharacterized protein EI90DRAFT_3127315 [Cantharellus anzutake]KAF8327256.1 hypothetical protein EI90DRAFT_3127315 [Cantharellus anzutake]